MPDVMIYYLVWTPLSRCRGNTGTQTWKRQPFLKLWENKSTLPFKTFFSNFPFNSVCLTFVFQGSELRSHPVQSSLTGYSRAFGCLSRSPCFCSSQRWGGRASWSLWSFPFPSRQRVNRTTRSRFGDAHGGRVRSAALWKRERSRTAHTAGTPVRYGDLHPLLSAHMRASGSPVYLKKTINQTVI